MTHKALLQRLTALSLASMLVLSSAPALAKDGGISVKDGRLIVEAPSDPSVVVTAPPDFVPTPSYQTPSNPVPSEKPETVLALYVNGNKTTPAPYYAGRTMMLPVKSIMKKAGWSYSYKNGVATMSSGSKTVVLKNGKLYGGTLYAAWTFFENKCGFNVTIHDNGRVDVKTKKYSAASIKVNGKSSDSAPYYTDDDVLMVPLRFVTESLGYTYQNDSDNRQAIFSAKDIDCYIKWDENRYPVDNEYVELECAPQIRNNTLYVPISFAEQALKCASKVSKGPKVVLTR